MVNVVPSNEKLRARAVRLVRLLTKASPERAVEALRRGEGRVMEALKFLRGAKVRK
jgi:N-acetylmuramic acid 6-phosphate (MurNAc-6-P) etherase